MRLNNFIHHKLTLAFILNPVYKDLTLELVNENVLTIKPSFPSPVQSNLPKLVLCTTVFLISTIRNDNHYVFGNHTFLKTITLTKTKRPI